MACTRRSVLFGLAAPVILSATSLDYVPRGVRLIKPHFVPGLGRVWQDAAGTIPAYDGDPVGLIEGGDLFNRMVQPDTACRPTLICQRYAGGLAFDGVDDFMAEPTGHLVGLPRRT